LEKSKSTNVVKAPGKKKKVDKLTKKEDEEGKLKLVDTKPRPKLGRPRSASDPGGKRDFVYIHY
jgi:hypothetical protein